MLTKFFIKNFMTFIIAVSIPVLIFSLMVMNVFQASLKEEIDTNTHKALNTSKETIELIFSDMNSMKILIDYNPQISLPLLRVLSTDVVTHEDTTALKLIRPSLKSSSYSRMYINSIYVKVGDSKYFLANGDKESITDYYDTAWYDSFKKQSRDTMLWTEKRRISDLDVVSIYQRTKLDGVIVINVRQEYFNKMLDSITTYDDQYMAVLNEKGELLFSNKDMEQLLERGDGGDQAGETARFADLLRSDRYRVVEMSSEHYSFKYVSVIPTITIYSSAILIIKLTLYSAIVSLLISSLLAYYFSIRNYRQIARILKIFKLAKAGMTLPNVVEKKKNDVYSLILNDTINSFVNQSHMNLQLSERKYRQVLAELTALQYQINPHFLFNTLQSINFEVLNVTQRPTFANTMIEQLSEILRYSLDSPIQMVTIREEIEITKKYIDIQRYRFDNTFKVTWTYEQDVLECSTIRLLLQPIIENSVHYGVCKEGGCCHITIQRDGDDIEFEITDNGPGMSEQRLDEVVASLESEPDYGISEHIGLRNISSRLRLKYGDEYKLSIRSAPGEGVTVTFRIKG
ncbi:cache domain-containing sensor histidine kinase [Paenibacillus hamazuiensis]|uniref:cache domain-containing sensor histidine kinase n=1 Tax=Paenibacillus hamazuiensis TaxID=2936508 RepID=UPI00200C7452|nr:sensor histidine kinase [Paenibacillus hamazuiensis]